MQALRNWPILDTSEESSLAALVQSCRPPHRLNSTNKPLAPWATPALPQLSPSKRFRSRSSRAFSARARPRSSARCTSRAPNRRILAGSGSVLPASSPPLLLSASEPAGRHTRTSANGFPRSLASLRQHHTVGRGGTGQVCARGGCPPRDVESAGARFIPPLP